MMTNFSRDGTAWACECSIFGNQRNVHCTVYSVLMLCCVCAYIALRLPNTMNRSFIDCHPIRMHIPSIIYFSFVCLLFAWLRLHSVHSSFLLLQPRAHTPIPFVGESCFWLFSFCAISLTRHISCLAFLVCTEPLNNQTYNNQFK